MTYGHFHGLALRAIVALAAAIMIGALSCSAFDDLFVPEPPSDGGATDGDPCTHASPPGSPDGETPGSGPDVDFTVVVRPTLSVPDSGSVLDIGYDLDGLCTCN